jgi:gliding motility-associated-like protein
VTNLPNPVITASGNTNLCLGDNVTLTATGGNSYSWSNGQTGPVITVNTEDTYTVTATNACGINTASINVNVDSVMALFSGNVYTGTAPLIVNFTNNSSVNTISNTWDFGDGNTSFNTSPSNTYLAPGTYPVMLTVSNSNGCSDTYSVTIIVIDNPSSLEMPNVFTPNGDAQNDLFMAISEGISEFDCSIYDRWGLKMADMTNINSGWDGRTTSGVLASDGTYFYVVKAKGADKKEYDLQGFVQLIRK